MVMKFPNFDIYKTPNCDLSSALACRVESIKIPITLIYREVDITHLY